MKRKIALILCAVLLFVLTAGYTETASEIHLSDYTTPGGISDIIWAADSALNDGMDPAAVIREMNVWAEENGLGDMLAYACENIASYGNDTYERIVSYETGEDTPHKLYLDYRSPYAESDRNGETVFDNYDVSQALKDLLEDKKAQYCYEPFCWTTAGFKQVFQTDYNQFKPTRSRAGYVCLVLSKDTQTAPETKWGESPWGENESEFYRLAIADTIEMIQIQLEEDAPVFTGNPELASEFWILEVKYPFYARYGTDGSVKGYNCSLSLTAVNATTRKPIATLSAQNKLGNTIYEWSDWIAKADIPVLQEVSGYDQMIGKLRAELIKERNTASAEKKITVFNASNVLNGLLAQYGEKISDAWQKAIFGSGAVDVSFTEDGLTFAMRSYRTEAAAAGSYQEAEDKRAWLEKALSSLRDYDTELSLELKDGRPTNNGLNALKASIGKMATEAKKAFSNQEMKNAIAEDLFPEPIEATKGVEAEQLLHPSESFRNFLDLNGDLFYRAPAEAWSALFYGQGKQAVTVESGPHAITLKSANIDAKELLNLSVRAVLDSQAYLPREERLESTEELESALLTKIAETALQLKKKANQKLTVTVDLDERTEGKLPEAYREYMESFDYPSYTEMLFFRWDQLLDIAAIEMPKTGWISGSKAGTQVKFSLAADSEATYIQMRDADTEEIVVTAFVHPGKQASVRVPKGEYYIRWCSGPYWYGEQDLFGTIGSYSKSEIAEIKGTNYVHNFRLESVDNGDISFQPASPDDFR